MGGFGDNAVEWEEDRGAGRSDIHFCSSGFECFARNTPMAQCSYFFLFSPEYQIF